MDGTTLLQITPQMNATIPGTLANEITELLDKDIEACRIMIDGTELTLKHERLRLDKLLRIRESLNQPELQLPDHVPTH